MRHDRYHLLQIGIDLFSRHGYHAVGTQQILAEAKYPRSSFYHHFKHKAGFAQAAIQQYSEQQKATLESYVHDDSVKSPLQRIKNYFQIRSEVFSNSNHEQPCLVMRLGIDCTGDDKAIVDLAKNELNAWKKMLKPVIKEAQKAGEIRSTSKSKEIASILFASFYGAMCTSKIKREQGEMDKLMENTFIGIQQ